MQFCEQKINVPRAEFIQENGYELLVHGTRVPLDVYFETTMTEHHKSSSCSDIVNGQMRHPGCASSLFRSG